MTRILGYLSAWFLIISTFATVLFFIGNIVYLPLALIFSWPRGYSDYNQLVFFIAIYVVGASYVITMLMSNRFQELEACEDKKVRFEKELVSVIQFLLCSILFLSIFPLGFKLAGIIGKLM